jgi:hypothetical protein
MSQIALPLSDVQASGCPRIVIGSANARVIEGLRAADTWPFRTAVLFGPARSGKSLLARWFADEGLGEAVDDADTLPEADLFHRWNRAQESGRPLLIVCNRAEGGWPIALPDLASRMGAALHLSVGTPDDALLGDLAALHAEMRGLSLDPAAISYLVPRCERSHVGIEHLVATIDRLSLERKQPPTLGLMRDALEEISGAGGPGRQPRLL